MSTQCWKNTPFILLSHTLLFSFYYQGSLYPTTYLLEFPTERYLRLPLNGNKKFKPLTKDVWFTETACSVTADSLFNSLNVFAACEWTDQPFLAAVTPFPFAVRLDGLWKALCRESEDSCLRPNYTTNYRCVSSPLLLSRSHCWHADTQSRLGPCSLSSLKT